MYLINDDQGDFLYIVSVLPGAAHTVPLLRGGNYEICWSYGSHVRCYVSCHLHHSDKYKQITSNCRMEDVATYKISSFAGFRGSERKYCIHYWSGHQVVKVFQQWTVNGKKTIPKGIVSPT